VTKHSLQLGFQRQVSEDHIDRLAADDAVVVIFGATPGGCHEVLDAGFTVRNGFATEEAAIALKEEKTFELLHSGA
jgi:hypothetical protein